MYDLYRLSRLCLLAVSSKSAQTLYLKPLYQQGDDYVRDMWNYICPELFKSLQTEMEPDILAVVMESVATCVEV